MLYQFLEMCLLCLIVGVGFDANASLLPKTTQAQSIEVFDLTQDLAAENDRAQEAYYAITAIQGLVNRTNTDKAYFTNTPIQFSWGNPGPPYSDPDDQAALEDGLIPVSQLYKPSVNTNLTYPVLGCLLSRYSNYIHGMVMIPDVGSAKNCDGAFAAAFTACGILDAIPVSAGISNYIASLGFNFPVLADTRSLSNNVMAFQWAYTNYFRTNTCRNVIAFYAAHGYGFGPTASFADGLDYWIANRAFVFCLDPYVAAQNGEIALLLNTNNYPYATPIQAVEYSESDAYMFDSYGYPDDVAFFANMSVTCSFPSVSTNILTPTPEVPANIDPNGVYIGFYVSDGDSFDVTTRMHYYGITRVYTNNTYPVGWTINPEFYDLFPTLLQYLSRYNAYPTNAALGENTNTLEFISTGFHGSYPQTNGYSAFINRYQYYQQSTHGLFRLMDLGAFEGSGLQTPPLSPAETIAADAGFSEFVSGYEGDSGTVARWAFLNVSNVVNTTLVSGISQNQLGSWVAAPHNIVSAVNNNLRYTRSGQPVFIIFGMGGGDPGYPDATAISAIAPAMQELNLNPNGRHYYCLRPSDVAGAWKKWYQSLDNQLENPNWEPTTVNGTNGGRDWTYTYTNNNEGAYQLNDFYYTGYNPVNDGTYGFLKAQVTGNHAGDFQFATSETHPATAGSLWQASAYFEDEKNSLHGSQVGQIILEFQGMSNQSFSNVVVDSSGLYSSGENTWYLGTVSTVAPTGTTNVCMKVGLYEPSADGVSGHVLVDNAVLGPVAPP